MPQVSYRMYYDNNPATREQLDMVEEIVVQQALDMAWEARLRIPICTDDKGNWSGENEDFLRSFRRVRLEIKVGDGGFVPLIDGPVVGHDTQMTSEPGQSVLTVIVQDDSVYLNQEESVEVLENRLDHEIAKEFFAAVEQIAETDIEETPPPEDDLPSAETRRGTRMQLLRKLAKRNGFHTLVLPGPEPGKSIGVFRKLSTEPSDLPAMVLLGEDRNIRNFDVRHNAQRPGAVQAFGLRFTDKGVVSATAQHRDAELLGEEAALTGVKDTPSRLLPPSGDANRQPREAAKAEAERSSYAFEATGEVRPDCYHGVLSPPKVVTVKGVNGRLSGNYIIKSVTHRLTRSEYTQSFGLIRNAESSGSGASSLGDLVGAIF